MSLIILHIHKDYPDGRERYPHTKAVSNLVDSVKEFEHYVVSINRTSNPFHISAREFDQGLSIVYWAIPLPFLHNICMWIVSLWIMKLLGSRNFHIVHSHKITIEGLIGEYCARKRNVPLVLSLRGGSDIYYLSKLKLHHKNFKRVIQSSKHIFLTSPWAKNKVEEILGVQIKSFSNFPNMCNIDNDQLDKEKVFEKNRYLTVLNFYQYKRKAILELIDAIALVKARGVDVNLDIYGGGDSKVTKIISNKILENKLQDSILLKGQVLNKDLLTVMPNYKGLLLPSSNETFGMVYIEAVASGLPILYRSNTGIDGYFDDEDRVGVKVKSQCFQDIADGIWKMDGNHEIYKENVKFYLASGKIKKFHNSNIMDTYRKYINRVVYE